MPTLYELLGVPRKASTHAIEHAFRVEGFKYHPDRNPGDEEAVKKFKELNNAKDILLDPFKRADYDCQLPRNWDYDADSDDLDSDSESEETDNKDFRELYYSTTPRNYRSRYSGDAKDDGYDEHRHYVEEYTPQGVQRQFGDDDPLDEIERAHCHYEPYAAESNGLKNCQGCKELISPNDTECSRAKHIIEPSRYYVTKCCKYLFHANCYRRALFDSLDTEGRFRCKVCHNYAEGDLVYHAFNLEIFPDVDYTTSPSPWRVADADRVCDVKLKNIINNGELEEYLNDSTCSCFERPEESRDELKQCRCFTRTCFICKPHDHVRWWFHLLKKRIVDPSDYTDFLWRQLDKGTIDAASEGDALLEKILEACPEPPSKVFRPNPTRPEQMVEGEEVVTDGVGQMVIE